MRATFCVSLTSVTGFSTYALYLWKMVWNMNYLYGLYEVGWADVGSAENLTGQGFQMILGHVVMVQGDRM
jgi:hypothetical protein